MLLFSLFLSARIQTVDEATPQRQQKKSCKNLKKVLDNENMMCYHVGVHQRYGHKTLAEYLRRRKENRPPGSVDHVQTHTLGDWGI